MQNNGASRRRHVVSRAIRIALGVLVGSGLICPSADAGQLGDIRNQLDSSSSSPGSSSSGSSSSRSSGSDCDDDGDSIIGSILSGLFCGSDDDSCSSSSCDSSTSSSDDGGWCAGLFDVVTTPWGLPHRLAGDNLSFPTWTAIPYEDTSCKDWCGQFRAEYADDFDDLMRTGGRLILEGPSRFGIDGEWNYWQENLGGSDRDWLTTGDANIVYRFAQNERLAMRSGIGLAWLDDQVADTHFGFNFTYGLDYYPCKPLVLTADIDWGTLAGRSLFHGRATAGVMIRRTQVYVGYDYYDVGDVGLNGLVAGVGVWF